jgi:hypothetical protein
LFLPCVDSDPWRMGLEGIGASLLGMGVMEAGGRVKAVLDRVETGVFFIIVGMFLAVVGVDGAGLGELVDFFWKKPRMDFWPLPDCEPVGGCFFCEGRGVDISLPSTPRTMIGVIKPLKRLITRYVGRREGTVLVLLAN